MLKRNASGIVTDTSTHFCTHTDTQAVCILPTELSGCLHAGRTVNAGRAQTCQTRSQSKAQRPCPCRDPPGLEEQWWGSVSPPAGGGDRGGENNTRI